MRTAVIFAGLAIALLGPAALVVHKERVLASGQTVLLALAPVDPRSLMQGDYMVLDYAISRELSQGRLQAQAQHEDGQIVLRLDPKGVASLVRVHSPEKPLGEGELLLRYKLRDGRVRLGAEAFFFQEGEAKRYDGARYGELKVAKSGTSVLVGLRDAELLPL